MKIIKLSLTEEQISIIDKALCEAPFKYVAPIINEINKQIQEQLTEESNARNNT
jgi:DNA-binding MarR family transcriptional regulator